MIFFLIQFERAVNRSNQQATRFLILVHQNSRRYEFFDVSANNVIISRKTVKSSKNTICDLSAQISRRDEFCNIFSHTLVIRPKTAKSAKNTICDTCAKNSQRYESYDNFAHTVVITVKRSNQLGTRFLILVHRTRGDMSFLTLFFIQ